MFKHSRLRHRFPFLTFLLLRVVFWVIAYLYLSMVTQLVLVLADKSGARIHIKEGVIIAAFFGFYYGIAASLVGWFFERRFFYNKALWMVILGKIIVSLFVFVILISVIRYIIHPYVSKLLFDTAIFITEQRAWDAFFYILLSYNIIIELLITLINEVNKKYGPGVLLPVLLGKYKSPKEEERIFLFMDLKSSTTIAEALGHLKYSALIRDSFMDINSVVSRYKAQIYQYVGDEIVISWPLRDGLTDSSCIQFFFACQKKLHDKADHYRKQYERIPEFKAGLHIGKVTAVEVGDIKRDIAYLGDTLNTAARIQGICNDYEKNFLSSEYALKNMNVRKNYKIESMGTVMLKGKTEPVEIASIERLTP